MKRAFAGLALTLALILCCTAASSWTVDEIITEMMDNIDGERLGLPNDDSEFEFDQKIEYDEQTNTFTHLIYCPAFVYPCFAPMEDLGLDMDEIWAEIWTSNRRDAENWLLNDYAASLAFPGSTIIMKFVSCLDEESEDYLVYYSLTMDDNYKVTILENNLTDDLEPVYFK